MWSYRHYEQSGCTVTRTDEWYTDEATVRKCYELLDPMPGSRVLCPFDNEMSQFVKIGKELGHEVIYGITDFVEATEYECDYIITNPPFSMKDLVIRKVFEYGKRAVLVMPLDVLGGIERRKLYQRYEFPKIWMPVRRISYFDKSWIKRPASNFHSILMTLNHGQCSVIEWELENGGL
jgi:hypothetical protein